MIELAEDIQNTEETNDIRFDDFPALEPSPSQGKKIGRPRIFPEGTSRSEMPSQQRKPKLSGKVDTEIILQEIQKLRDENPTKKQKEIYLLFMESKRDWILAKLFDTAENGDTPTIRFNAQARLKDELDGRVATQEKKDPDEDDAIGKILIPDEM